MTDQGTVELKACPFCGKPPVTIGPWEDTDGSRKLTIGCSESKCCNPRISCKPEFAVEYWNTRPSSLPSGTEAVACWIVKDVLEALKADKFAKGTVASGLLKKPMPEFVPLYAAPPAIAGVAPGHTDLMISPEAIDEALDRSDLLSLLSEARSWVQCAVSDEDPEDPTYQLLERIDAALRGQPALSPTPSGEAPVGYISREQFEALGSDPSDEGGAGYLPFRRTAAGKFQMALYASSPKGDEDRELRSLDEIAEAVHRGRFPGDLEPTPFADEDQSGREYCYRIARNVAALSEARVSERSSNPSKCEREAEKEGDEIDPADIDNCSETYRRLQAEAANLGYDLIPSLSADGETLADMTHLRDALYGTAVRILNDQLMADRAAIAAVNSLSPSAPKQGDARNAVIEECAQHLRTVADASETPSITRFFTAAAQELDALKSPSADRGGQP